MGKADSKLNFNSGWIKTCSSLRRAGKAPASRRMEQAFSRFFSPLKYGQLTVTFPSGKVQTFRGALSLESETLQPADLTLHSWDAIGAILAHGDIGLGESYMAGKWETTDLTALLLLLSHNMEHGESVHASLYGLRLLDKITLFLRRNSRKGSDKNIAYHYDLGNDFYKLWLDESMTYSSALFSETDQNLEQAQAEKYRQIATSLNLQNNDRILEIGCGWGGFAEFAAKEFGCHVTGLTLSIEQAEFARNRLSQAGLSENSEILLKDYRDMDGQFDHIVSIEMMEAVGEQYWPKYFGKIKQLLKPSGRAAIQVITIENHRFNRYRGRLDFIQKHIFPGGFLPSDTMFKTHSQNAGLALVQSHGFGQDYATTLRLWRERFLAAKDQVLAQGFDARFMRMWVFYLCYCEAGFTHKNIDVKHYIIGKSPA